MPMAPEGYTYSMSKSLADYGVPSFDTPSDACLWVHNHIGYIADDYLQTPEETLQKRAGDCKDYTLLWMYIVHEQFGLSPSLLEVEITDIRMPLEGHCIGEIDTDLYDPTLAGIPGMPWYLFFTVATVDYNSAIYDAVTTHKLPLSK